LTTVARYRPANLTVMVLDNESFATFGAGMMSATAAGVDLAAVARGCGIEKTTRVDTLEQAERAMPRGLHEPGPCGRRAKEDRQSEPDPRFARGSADVTEQSLDFARMLRRSAGA